MKASSPHNEDNSLASVSLLPIDTAQPPGPPSSHTSLRSQERGPGRLYRLLRRSHLIPVKFSNSSLCGIPHLGHLSGKAHECGFTSATLNQYTQSLHERGGSSRLTSSRDSSGCAPYQLIAA